MDIGVLLVDSDFTRRSRLGLALQAAGIRVATADRLAEIERWPVGEIVVTDYARFTPWWNDVGAATVVVIADTIEQRAMARRRGATTWISGQSPPEDLALAIANLAGRLVDTA